jgi:hypothetical protein
MPSSTIKREKVRKATETDFVSWTALGGITEEKPDKRDKKKAYKKRRFDLGLHCRQASD